MISYDSFYFYVVFYVLFSMLVVKVIIILDIMVA